MDLAGQRGGGIPRASAFSLIDDQPGHDAISYKLITTGATPAGGGRK